MFWDAPDGRCGRGFDPGKPGQVAGQRTPSRMRDRGVSNLPRITSLCVLFLVLLWTLPGAAAVPISAADRPIRLELLSHHRVREITIASATDLRVSSGVYSHTIRGPVRLLWQRTALFIEHGGKTEVTTATRVAVTSVAPLTVSAGKQSASMTGSLDLRRAAHGLQIIAALPLEEYLCNVVTGEGGDMPAQALRAMAVLARTWALENRGRHQRGGFDFCSSTHCEVWPLHPPSARAINAVEQTRGEVLTYHDRFAEVFYSANCGGKTAPGSDFTGGHTPYLTSHADPWCAWSPQTNWTTDIPKSRLTGLMVKAGWLASTQQAWNIEVLRRDASGRVSELAVVGGASHVVNGRDFRFLVDRALGWNGIKSTLFDIADEGESLHFVGHGLGHGAGMCEAGAEGMARAGRNYRQILAFYFPGTTLLRLTESSPVAKERARHAQSVASLIPTAWHEEWHYAASGPCRVRYQDPLPQAVLDLCPSLVAEVQRRMGLTLEAPLRITVYPSAAAFIAATGRPGWVAAAARGHEIGLLPLALTERRRRLRDVLRHEILHVLIEDHASPHTAICLQEGAVIYFTGEARDLPSGQPLNDNRSLDLVLQSPHSEAEFEQALSGCAGQAAAIVHRHGEAALLHRLQQTR